MKVEEMSDVIIANRFETVLDDAKIMVSLL